MKKLLLTLVTAFAALSAHAIDYYLIGGFNNWTLSQANCKFTNQNDGTYVLDYNGTLTSGFKINDGTWSNDAANFGGSATLVIGQSYNLTVGGSSGNIPLSSNITKPHIVFNPTAKTLLITGQETQAEVIYGIHSNWYDTNWSTTNMTEKDGKWVLSTREIPAGTFGIKEMDKSTGSQTAWIAADGTAIVTPNTAMKCKVDGTNFSNPAGTFEVTFDPKAMTVTFSGTQTGEDAKPDYSSWYVNVLGPFNNYQDNGVQPVNGISTTTDLAIGTQGFKIKVWNGTDIYYVAESGSVPVDTWTKLIEDNVDASPTQIQGATASSIYTVKFNCETNEVYVTLTGGSVDPVYPEHVYLLGNIGQSGNWDISKAIDLNNEGDGFYSTEGVEFYPASDEDPYSYAVLATVNNWDNMKGNRYGPAANNTEIVDGEEMEFSNTGENETSWKLPAGVYSVNVSWEDMIVTFEKTGDLVTTEPELPTTMYVLGTLEKSDWNPDTFVKMDNSSAGVFTAENIVVTSSGTAYVAFSSTNDNSDGNWAAINAGRYGPKVNNSEAIVGVNEGVTNGELSWTINPGTYNFTLDLNAKTLTVAVPQGVELVTYELAGAIITSEIKTASMKVGDDGLATCTAIVWPQTFHVNKLVNGEVQESYGPASSVNAANEITRFGDYQGAVNNDLWTLSAVVCATAASPVTFTFNPDNYNLNVTASALYLRGDMNEWGTTMPFTFNQQDKNFTIEISENNPIKKGQGFKFADADWGTLNFGAGDVAPAAEDDSVVKTVTIVNGSANNIVLDSDFHGTITVNINANTATATFTQNTTSSVAGLEAADDAEAVYYNLQGAKVNNPERGIYVKVVNGKATKVIK